MGDSESKKEIDRQNDQKKTDDTAKKKQGFFKRVKSEFKKIIWPDKDKIIKETTAVVIVTVILGAVIALLDWVIKLGLDKIIQIG